ncbi:hypothetical protein HDA32_005605 [Spinactinospora alkalitolerans]|uniref:UDP-N-acetylglucosamine kinase n=1 Tax=Spinactinospora alkalitolerans TaxID=687207 RepID=A0A852U4N3_9ACTN|nr:zeta toxin family protein [Spinactinospora alkalitolerans]NYE50485.1 hypothetical protein [Spinactinospora alkalitolerans]
MAISSERYRLSDEALKDRFDEYVRAYVFEEHAPSGSPVLVLLGAQPAAGKSRAQQAVVRAYPGIVSLSGDDLRQFHPDYDDLMEQDPLAMPNATAQASGAWVAMSIDHARENGYSLLLEGVFRDPEMTLGTAAEFAQSPKKYRVEVVSLGVPEEVSRLDSVRRYLSPGDSPARWTPATAHDLGYRMSPQTVQACENSEHVHRITITDRSGADLFTNERGPDGAWTGPTGAKDAMLQARQRPLDPAAARDWLARRDDYTAAMVEREELNATTLPTLERLHADADRIAAQAYPHPEDARLKHRHAAGQHVHRHIIDSAAHGTPNKLLPATPETFLAGDHQLAYHRDHPAEHGDQQPAPARVEREQQRRASITTEQAEAEEQVRRHAHSMTTPDHQQPQHPSRDAAAVGRPRDPLRRDDHEPEPER